MNVAGTFTRPGEPRRQQTTVVQSRDRPGMNRRRTTNGLYEPQLWLIFSFGGCALGKLNLRKLKSDGLTGTRQQQANTCGNHAAIDDHEKVTLHANIRLQ